MTRKPKRFACSSSCSIEPARYVSLAASTTEYFSSLKNCATLAIVVVFPVPFIPTKSRTNGSFFLRFSAAHFKRSISCFVNITSKSTLRRLSSTTFLRSSNRLTCTPVKRFSSASQTCSATGKATSFSTRLILKSARTGRKFSGLSSAVVTLVTSPLNPFLSLSNIAWSFPLSHRGKQRLKSAPARINPIGNLSKLLLSRSRRLLKFTQPFIKHFPRFHQRLLNGHARTDAHNYFVRAGKFHFNV